MLGLVAVVAILGAQEGLVAGLLSLAGLVGGAILGGRLASAFLPSGSGSPYTPLLALAVAVAFAVVVQSLGLSLGLFVRSSFLRPAPLRLLDSAGGFVLGAAAGCVVAWVLGVVALQVPGQTKLRRDVQRSYLLRELNSVLPPRRILGAVARFDPFPAIGGPPANVGPPTTAVLRRSGVRAAAASVLKITGTACGLGVEGSGWVARPGLVVTAAHVVAGGDDTRVHADGATLPAQAVAFDTRNDIAVLRVSGLRARPLRLADASPGTAVAILGYPNDGPLVATPGRIGATTFLLSQDAYGRGPVGRVVTTLRGTVRHGDSGGPAVDAAGAVETTVYAARVGGSGGFGVPTSAVRRALDSAGAPVSTGACVR